MASSHRRLLAALSERRGHVGVVIVVTGLALLAAGLVGLNIAIVIAIIAFVVAGAVLLETARERRRGPGAPGVLRFVMTTFVVGATTFGLMQLLPYGRDHTNPPVTGEPQWANAETRELMVRACFGCHSNEVEWPWYTNIAPLSWAITDHVNEGRDKVNYSEFDGRQHESDETLEVILKGEMPPGYYTRFGLNREANLTDEELATLIEGLRATPGLSEDGEEDEAEDEEEEDEEDDDD